jgi:hypothetical protein
LANDESTSIPQRNLAEKLLNATIIRKKIKVFLSTHVIGIIYTRIMVVLSVLSGVQLIYQSYFEYEAYLSPSSKSILDSFQTLELFLSGFFFCDWCLSFFLADHKFEFITGFYSTVDLLTCIPIVFTYFNVRPSFEQIDSFYNGWIYFMYALNVTRLLRSLRLRRYLLTIENEVWRHLGEMFLVFIVMILFDATLMHFLESDRGLTFNAWLYYTFVTLTTVGYGDIAPLSIFGRFAAMSYILMAITIVPSMTNALVMKMNATTTYARAFFNLRKNTQHVVICGDLSSTSLSDFFRELLHEGMYIVTKNSVL